MRIRGRSFERARLVVAAIGSVMLAIVAASPAVACSPPFEPPTIAALGPDAVVVVGTIGERVEHGRLFHVRRAYSGGVTSTPIVIAFKEGEPVGDCSYPVSEGQRLVLAVARDRDARIHVDLATLQADPATPDGQRYIAEAESLFGPGSVPQPASTAPGPGFAVAALAAGVLAAGALAAVGAGLLLRRVVAGAPRSR